MVRDAAPGDAEAIDRILRESPQAARWLADDFRARSTAHILVWVAEQDAEVAGLIAARCVADQAEILDLAVAPRWRRQGIARALVQFALARIAEAGATSVFLEVRESNVPAQQFYARMGFVQGTRRRDYYRDPVEDALIFSLSTK